MAVEAGVNPKVVSERLGHAGIAITMDTYSHVSEPMQAGAADAVAALIATAGSKQVAELPTRRPEPLQP
jgi:integrase